VTPEGITMTSKIKARKTQQRFISATKLPCRVRAPREIRTVSSTRQFATKSKNQRLPLIRLSGAWLERVGFKRGATFLVIPDPPNQILLASIDR
jgi:hypothetical protein